MSGHMPLSYWPASGKPARSASSTKLRNHRGGGSNFYRSDGRSFNRCPPTAGAAAKEEDATMPAATAAAADCFVERKRSLSGEQQAAERGERYEAVENITLMPTRTKHQPGRVCAMAVLGLRAVLRIVRPASWWHFVIMLLLLLRPIPARAAVDLTIYGGPFDSSSTIAYAEVVQTCFGGLEVGSCQPSSPNWLPDFLDQYNEGMTGAYCAACCSNTDVSGDIWTFTCPLISTAFAEFVNHFGWEFRFGRRETFDDTEVITCPIPRTACTYDDVGALTAPCEADESWLASYVLSLEIMTIERGLSSWKSVQGCSVETEESATQPAEVAETISMTQVYASGSGIEAGWAAFIALVAFSILSCGVRYARDDRCLMCGHRLIWFWRVCLPCNFFGYVPPSKEVAEIIQDKRSVVLPEPTLSERIGTVKASTTKVFVQATEGIIPAGTVSKISSIRNGTFGKSVAGGAPQPGGRSSRNGSVENAPGQRKEGSVHGNGTERQKGRLPAISSARSVIFIGDVEDESPSQSPSQARYKLRAAKARSSAVEATQVAQLGGVSKGSVGEERSLPNASSKPRPLKRSPEWN